MLKSQKKSLKKGDKETRFVMMKVPTTPEMSQ